MFTESMCVELTLEGKLHLYMGIVVWVVLFVCRNDRYALVIRHLDGDILTSLFLYLKKNQLGKLTKIGKTWKAGNFWLVTRSIDESNHVNS